MPVRAGIPCKDRGCVGVMRNGTCNKCGASTRRDKDRAFDQHRGSAHERGYGATWQRVRMMQLSSQPLCEDCKANRIVTVATEVHHIKARRDGGADSFDNLMSLCKTHHSKRTARGE